MDPTYKARSALVFKLTNFSKLSIHLLTTDSGSSQGLHAQAFRKDRVNSFNYISHTAKEEHNEQQKLVKTQMRVATRNIRYMKKE